MSTCLPRGKVEVAVLDVGRLRGHCRRTMKVCQEAYGDTCAFTQLTLNTDDASISFATSLTMLKPSPVPEDSESAWRKGCHISVLRKSCDIPMPVSWTCRNTCVDPGCLSSSMFWMSSVKSLTDTIPLWVYFNPLPTRTKISLRKPAH